MSSIRDFTLTKHAIERLRERNEKFAVEVDVIPETALKKKATYQFMYGATEEKSFLNNSSFMTALHEKYGFDNRYSFFSRENSIFVGVSNETGDFIVTVLNKDQHTVPHLRNSTKKFSSK